MIAYEYVPDIESYVLTVNTAYASEEIFTSTSEEEIKKIYQELKFILDTSLEVFITQLVEEESIIQPMNNIEIAKIFIENRKRGKNYENAK